jgi:hypothetical protein
MINNECLGSDFDDFLRNERFIDDAEAVAAKKSYRLSDSRGYEKSKYHKNGTCSPYAYK